MVGLWVVAWVGLGIAVHQQVQGLAQLSQTVVSLGGAVEQTGLSLRALGDVPLVGGEVADAAAAVVGAGEQTVAAGRASEGSVHGLAWLLGAAVGLIPSLPVLIVYGWLRVNRARQRRALHRFAELHGADPVFERFLAHRAVFGSSYEQLSRLGQAPWRDYLAGDLRRLSAFERERPHGPVPGG